MFKRRIERSPLQKAREMLWPSSGFKRTVLYLWRRLVRLKASPHKVGLGFSIGVFISFSPFIGIHLVLSGLFAWIFRANIVASLLGNFLGNPLTYPFIWAGVYQTGLLILGGGVPEVGNSGFDASHIEAIFVLFLVGSIPVGLAVGLLFYFPVKIGVVRFQAARRERFIKTHPTLAAGAIPSQTSTGH